MIRLSRLVDYAVLILCEMTHEKDALYSATELATRTKLNKPTVSKILKSLNNADLILSVRGTNGGYKLNKETTEIAISDVITAIEGPIAITCCSTAESTHNCSLKKDCVPSLGWQKVNRIIHDAFNDVKLIDFLTLHAEGKNNV
ncbi:MAG: SUF system Fe-S cluster assembly regulator [Alphaproteobacteria bacterium]